MSHLDRTRARWPDAGPALTLPDGTVRSWPELDAAIARAAGWLTGRGLSRGDVLALQGRRHPAFLDLHLAALGLGIGTLPMNPRYTRREVHTLLDDAEPALAILVDPDDAPPDRTGPVLAFDAVADALPRAHPAPPVGATDDDLALLCYTSGTTGRPKGARILHRHLHATVTALHQAWAWSSDDVQVHALPLFHIHGLVVAQHGALYAGAHTIWLDRFTPEGALSALAEHDATVFMGVPTFHQRLIAVPEAPDLPAMRLFTSGSAPLSAATHAAFEARFGHRILERYGMTEVGIVLSNPYDGVRVAGSVGRPLPGVSCRIVALEDADGPHPGRAPSLPPGEVGEVLIQGPSVFDGYLNRPEATARALRAGWMHTGDLGLTDARGYVHLRGRRGDMILVGGFNVYPLEVESVLETLPGVHRVAVYGVPDDDLGECVEAAVVPETPGAVDPQGLRAAAREQLTGYKVPRRVVLLDALPRNAMGKVLKATLRARASSGGPA